MLLLAAGLLLHPTAFAETDQLEPRHSDAAEIASLEQLLNRVRHSFRGRILQVELETEDENDLEDGWVYEVKILTPHGQLIKLTYDAHDLSLLGVKGRYPLTDDDDD